MSGGSFRSAATPSRAMGGGTFRSAATNSSVRNAQASMGTAPTAGFSGRNRFSGGHDRDRDHDRRGRGRGIGFVAGLAAGSALGYGYDTYYGDGYYGDSYVYNDDYGAEPGYVVSSEDDASYCAQRYRSYDPASGTYLGYDGERHPCP